MHEEVVRLTGSGCWDFPPLTVTEITYWETHIYLLKEKGKFLSSLHKEGPTVIYVDFVNKSAVSYDDLVC